MKIKIFFLLFTPFIIFADEAKDAQATISYKAISKLIDENRRLEKRIDEVFQTDSLYRIEDLERRMETLEEKMTEIIKILDKGYKK